MSVHWPNHHHPFTMAVHGGKVANTQFDKPNHFPLGILHTKFIKHIFNIHTHFINGRIKLKNIPITVETNYWRCENHLIVFLGANTTFIINVISLCWLLQASTCPFRATMNGTLYPKIDFVRITKRKLLNVAKTDGESFVRLQKWPETIWTV